jgi:hypothetical protein
MALFSKRRAEAAAAEQARLEAEAAKAEGLRRNAEDVRWY